MSRSSFLVLLVFGVFAVISRAQEDFGEDFGFEPDLDAGGDTDGNSGTGVDDSTPSTGGTDPNSFTGEGPFWVGGVSYSTLQSAHDNAGTSDVFVAEGTVIDVSNFRKNSWAVSARLLSRSPRERAILDFGGKSCLGTLGVAVKGFRIERVDLRNFGCENIIDTEFIMEDVTITGGWGVAFRLTGQGSLEWKGVVMDNTGIIHGTQSKAVSIYFRECIFRNIHSELYSAIELSLQAARLGFSRCTFENCQSSNNGGAVTVHFVARDDSDEDGTENELRIERTKFLGNYANNHGGAIYSSGPGVVTLHKAEFEGNVANYKGGAIALSGDSLALMRNFDAADPQRNDFFRNSAYAGGAISMEVSTLAGAAEWINYEFRDNVARRDPGGGAVKISYKEEAAVSEGPRGTVNEEHAAAIAEPTAYVRFTSCVFEGNQAFAGSGGAVWANVPVGFVSSSIMSNGASLSGGGVFSFSQVRSSQSDFLRNWANSGGGVNTYSLVALNSNFTLNDATYGPGGGVYLSGVAAVLVNTVFANNFAEQGGGGLFGKVTEGDSVQSLAQNLKLSNCTFRRNVAGETAPFLAGGLHIYSYGSKMRVDESSVFFRNGGQQSGAISILRYPPSDLNAQRSAEYTANPSVSLASVELYDVDFDDSGPWDFTLEKPYEFCSTSGPDIFTDNPVDYRLENVIFRGDSDGQCINNVHPEADRTSLVETCNGGQQRVFGPGFLGCVGGCEVRYSSCGNGPVSIEDTCTVPPPVSPTATRSPVTYPEEELTTTPTPTPFDPWSTYEPPYIGCKEAPVDIWPPPLGYRSPGLRTSAHCQWEDSDEQDPLAVRSIIIYPPNNNPNLKGKTAFNGWGPVVTTEGGETEERAGGYYRRRRMTTDWSSYYRKLRA